MDGSYCSGIITSPREYFTMSETFLDCHNLEGQGTNDFRSVEARYTVKYPITHRTATRNKINYLVQNIISAKGEKPCSKLTHFPLYLFQKGILSNHHNGRTKISSKK